MQTGPTSRIVDRGAVFKHEPGTTRQSTTFPGICVLPSGRWLCGFRAGATKEHMSEQHSLLTWSDDQGKTWRAPFEPHKPQTINGSPGLTGSVRTTALGDRQVVGICWWIDHSDPSAPLFNGQTEGLLDMRLLLSFSQDEGESWSEPQVIDTSPFNVPTPVTGPVLRLSNGELACQFELNKPYNDTTPWRHKSVLMFSADGGRSWPTYSVVSDHPDIFYWDQRPSVLGDGSILDLFWTFDRPRAVYLNIQARESHDNGRTWSELWDTGLPGQPAPAVPLPSGELALVYVDRTGAPIIRLRKSADGGRTWPEETDLVIRCLEAPSQTWDRSISQNVWDEVSAFSLGLPDTAALPNGQFVVVYYAGPHTDRTDIEWVLIDP